MSTAPAHLPRDPDVPLVGVDGVLRAITDRLDQPDLPVTVAVLFGKPGRGKTSMAEMLGRTRGEWFQEINASSERRGQDLREALSRFVSDGNQRGLRHKLRGAGSAGAAAAAASPIGVLLLDEADGLGEIGQATVASFLAELEDNQVPRRGNWRACVVVACNMMGAMHDVVLSRAHVLMEMPRPSPATLIAAARSWAGPTLPADRIAALPEDALAALAARADGDFRAMRQLLTIAIWGAAGPGAEGAVDALGRPASEAKVSAAESHPFLSAGPLRCPRALARLLISGEGAYDTRPWQEVWEQGHRADVVCQWAEMAVANPSVPPAWRRRLVRFRRELANWDGPDTLLQLIGVFARTSLDLGKAAREA
jgi:hypothetical protein